MRFFSRLNKSGFSLIELMIVMSVVGILASISVPNYRWGLIKAREAVLRENLYTLQSTINQFFADQGRYPDNLPELTKSDRQYLRDIPKDITGKNDTWQTQGPMAPSDGSRAEGGVSQVHSGSLEVGSNNIPYNEW